MIKGAIIGFGNQAEYAHLPIFLKMQKLLKITACADTCEKRLNFVRRNFPKIRTYSNVDNLLKKESLDFVDICTPPAGKAEIIERVVERQIDMLCEKPIIMRVEELNRIETKIRKSGIFFFPCHSWKYAPHYLYAKQLIDSGVIGDIYLIKMANYRNSFAMGNEHWRPKWRIDPKISGGGVFMDHGYHMIYLSQWIFDQEPISVKARFFNYNSNAEDTAICQLQFKKGISRLKLTWVSHQRLITNLVMGTDGLVAIFDDRVELWNANRCSRRVRFSKSLSESSWHGDWYGRLISHFLSQIQKNPVDNIWLNEAAITSKCIFAAYASNFQGGPQVRL